jgi:hypothetical protein
MLLPEVLQLRVGSIVNICDSSTARKFAHEGAETPEKTVRNVLIG